MKKFLTLLLLGILASFSLATFSPVLAKETAKTEPMINPTHIEYNLAFPGILPDNPLYNLKLLRDKLIEKMLKNPRKRVDFYLAQADKGILSTAMLVDKNEFGLSQTTLLKAENNMTLITNDLLMFDFKRTPELLPKLQRASLKHQEVLSTLLPRVPADSQKIFETVLEFSKRNQQTIEHYYETIP